MGHLPSSRGALLDAACFRPARVRPPLLVGRGNGDGVGVGRARTSLPSHQACTSTRILLAVSWLGLESSHPTVFATSIRLQVDLPTFSFEFGSWSTGGLWRARGQIFPSACTSTRSSRLRAARMQASQATFFACLHRMSADRQSANPRPAWCTYWWRF